jgi:hypothetical protein
MEPLRSAAKAAGLGNGDEGVEELEVQHDYIF